MSNDVEMDAHLDGLYEWWSRLSPMACLKCGAFVTSGYSAEHLEWHTSRIAK